MEFATILGTPSDADIDAYSQLIDKSLMRLLRKIGDVDRKPLQNVLSIIENVYGRQDLAEASDLLEKIILWTPSDRISAKDALKHPFFEGFK